MLQLLEELQEQLLIQRLKVFLFHIQTQAARPILEGQLELQTLQA